MIEQVLSLHSDGHDEAPFFLLTFRYANMGEGYKRTIDSGTEAYLRGVLAQGGIPNNQIDQLSQPPTSRFEGSIFLAQPLPNVTTNRTRLERSWDKVPKLLIWSFVVTVFVELILLRLPHSTASPLLGALLVVFGIFCLSILAFAIAYQRLYRKNSSHFLFNKAITKRPKK